jgi:hypothetical protein
VDLIVLGQRGLGPHEGLLGGVARKIVNMTQISCLIATWSSVGGTSMNSRERMRLALNHREPDRVPFDLGGTDLSTIHVTAYRNLRQHLGLPEVQPGVAFVPEQLVRVDADLAERLQADVCPVLPGTSSTFEYVFRDEGEYEAYTDEWGIGWRMPKEGGFYRSNIEALAPRGGLCVCSSARYPGQRASREHCGYVGSVAGVRGLCVMGFMSG